MNAFEDFEQRGLVYDVSEGAAETLGREKITVYIGFDPTADSLHVGSLLPIMVLARLQRHGHRPIALVGGGTGMIGDPSGKSQERQLLTPEQVDHNLVGIRRQLERFLDFESASNPARLVDNGEWLRSISLVDFLRDIGKHFTVNYMLAKDSVQRRLSQEAGISYTELSYMLLQSYDFLVLHDQYGCQFQMGGSDQWGNITAGAELIRRLRRKKAYGMVFPLITTASGQKFGKTEAGTVWLDSRRTSPFRFYQFWLNARDEDAIPYLKYFTWLDHDAIGELEAALQERPEERRAQKRLAREVTTMVHGETACARAEHSSTILFGGEIGDLGSEEILEIFDDVPSSTVAASSVSGDGQPLVELLMTSGLCESKGAARRLIRDGGGYVNNRRVGDERHLVTREDFIEGRILVLRKGQKKTHLIMLEGD